MNDTILEIINVYLLLIGVNTVLFSLDLGFYLFTVFSRKFDRYLIQKDRNNRHLHENYQLILTNICLIISTLLVFIIMISNIDHDKLVGDWPSLWEIGWQNLVILVVDDLYFYWYHRLLHTKFLYKWIHSIHHKARNPNVLDFLYAHPLEPVIGSFAIVGCYLALVPHMITIVISIIIRHLHESEIHSGHDFPWSLTRLIGGGWIANTKDHDLHHLKVRGNYGNMFKIWDTFWQTNILF